MPSLCSTCVLRISASLSFLCCKAVGSWLSRMQRLGRAAHWGVKMKAGSSWLVPLRSGGCSHISSQTSRLGKQGRRARKSCHPFLLCSMVVCALMSCVLRACVCVVCSLLFDMVIPWNCAEVYPSPFCPCSPPTHLYISKSFVAKCKGAEQGLVCS